MPLIISHGMDQKPGCDALVGRFGKQTVGAFYSQKIGRNETSTAAIALLPLDRPVCPTRMSCGLKVQWSIDPLPGS